MTERIITFSEKPQDLAEFIAGYRAYEKITETSWAFRDSTFGTVFVNAQNSDNGLYTVKVRTQFETHISEERATKFAKSITKHYNGSKLSYGNQKSWY
ncbi:MAG: hypothetical protein AABX73_00895 [Nanoarchaeota archaeon]